MSQDFISSTNIIGEKDRLDAFYAAFVKEGLEIIKPSNEHMDDNATRTWRINNWGVIHNIEETFRQGKYINENELHISTLTTNGLPLKFLQHISSLYDFHLTLTCNSIIANIFAFVEINKGQEIKTINTTYISAEAIEFYGEETYKSDLAMLVKWFLEEKDVSKESMLEPMMEKLLPFNIKELILDTELLDKKVQEAYDLLSDECI